MAATVASRSVLERPGQHQQPLVRAREALARRRPPHVPRARAGCRRSRVGPQRLVAAQGQAVVDRQRAAATISAPSGADRADAAFCERCRRPGWREEAVEQRRPGCPGWRSTALPTTISRYARRTVEPPPRAGAARGVPAGSASSRASRRSPISGRRPGSRPARPPEVAERAVAAQQRVEQQAQQAGQSAGQRRQADQRRPPPRPGARPWPSARDPPPRVASANIQRAVQPPGCDPGEQRDERYRRSPPRRRCGANRRPERRVPGQGAEERHEGKDADRQSPRTRWRPRSRPAAAARAARCPPRQPVAARQAAWRTTSGQARRCPSR